MSERGINLPFCYEGAIHNQALQKKGTALALRLWLFKAVCLEPLPQWDERRPSAFDRRIRVDRRVSRKRFAGVPSHPVDWMLFKDVALTLLGSIRLIGREVLFNRMEDGPHGLARQMNRWS